MLIPRKRPAPPSTRKLVRLLHKRLGKTAGGFGPLSGTEAFNLYMTLGRVRREWGDRV